MDEYRSELFRVVGDEMHDFFDRVDLGHEIQEGIDELEVGDQYRDSVYPERPRRKWCSRARVTDVKTKTKVRRSKSEDVADKRLPPPSLDEPAEGGLEKSVREHRRLMYLEVSALID